jgi:hypothetical protein
MTAILIDLRPTFKQRREAAQQERRRQIALMKERTDRRRQQLVAALSAMDAGVQMPCDVEG